MASSRLDDLSPSRRHQAGSAFPIYEDPSQAEINSQKSVATPVSTFDTFATRENHTASKHASKFSRNSVGDNQAAMLSTSKSSGNMQPMTFHTSPENMTAEDLSQAFSSIKVSAKKHGHVNEAPVEELFAKLSKRQSMLSAKPQGNSAEQAAPGTTRMLNTAPETYQLCPTPNLSKTPECDSQPDELAQLRQQLAVAQSKLAHIERKSADTQTPDDADSAGPDIMQLDGRTNVVARPINIQPVTWDGMPLNASGTFFQPIRREHASTNRISPAWPVNGGNSSTDYMSGINVSDGSTPFLTNIQDWNNGVVLPGDASTISRPGSSMSYALHPREFSRYQSDLSQVPGGPFDRLAYAGGPTGNHAFRSGPYDGTRTSRLNDTRLSPTAMEFNAGQNGAFPEFDPWNMQPNNDSQPSYLSNTEPLNYRRLLEKNMSCNWKYVVDKIVCSNDQQASIFLQQKLKIGTGDQKKDIVQAIIDQAYPLMINRFGNFLVQRCFEHGSPEQIIAIARAIRGNTLNLSMDAFGCHVVQKAFDSVPEEYKAIMVHELLRRIPETVIHRYACHVWQKLFELRWNGSPPQIMKYVNEALRGMWHEVALGETGSLVVQNIFENCLEEDKRPCVNEVLGSIDVVAHGQFGNWCIQHICEHGTIPDRTRATEHVLRFATEYSMDQFASKVVEKCLKIGGSDFLDRYLDRVCEARSDRPRMPLIDIAGDQFGNYLIQYVLTHADPQRREVVASHIRKHMVSLRGSKYGSRVAMLCCNPAHTTRPGPPTGIPMPIGRGHSANAWSDRSGPRDRPYGGSREGSWWT